MPGIVLGTEDIKMMIMMVMTVTLMMLMMMIVVMTLITNATYPLQICILSTLFILANGLLTSILGGWYYYFIKYTKDENTEAQRG